MERDDIRYRAYIEILKQELIPAMGCTEPIAVAYCSALARRTLQQIPDKVEIFVSGNIVKNVKSVIVPNTGGMKGIKAAAAAGIVAGDPDKELEVISVVSERQKEQIREYLDITDMSVSSFDGKREATGELLDILVEVWKDGHSAKARLAGHHTHVVLLQREEEVLYQDEPSKGTDEGPGKEDLRKLLSVEDIFDFAQSVDLQDIHGTIDRQIRYNTAISEEGLRHSYGANIGKVIRTGFGNGLKERAKAAAAAGSDARMSGCELPVVVNSGSGNQGLTVSLPVIEYAKEMGATQEKLYRALTLSNLIAIHEKQGIGCLSAYCGAVSAGAAAGCGIAYLCGGGLKAVTHTLVNALAITSGMVCDGAKPSCAAKIAVAVEAGILGYEMYCRGQQFRDGDGIVKKGVENTIRNVGRLGSLGMRETDREIIRIMTE